MSESAAGSYASLGGTEIVNDERTVAYLLNGLRPPSLDVRGSCSCENIAELVGDAPYTTPEIDDAPWFSSDIPESGRFAGFLVSEFEGMGSTFTRAITETIHDGAILGRGRLNARTMVWKGFLLGADCCAVAYGLRWLTKVLSDIGDCRDCDGEDLELLVCCPEIISESFGIVDTEGVEALRKLKNVGLIVGPTVLSNHKTGCGNCGASCITEIEFSLVAAQPFMYSAPIPLYECESLALNKSTRVSDSDVSCAPTNCADILLESTCPSPDLPPTATYTNSCFVESPIYSALYLTVPRAAWGSLEEVVPVITISTGPLSIQSIILGFYTSISDNPCGDLITNPPNCDVMCDELKIIVIPPLSKFYIDGRTKQMALICNDGSVFPGEPLTAGPWSWPSFSKFGFCLEVLFPDNSTTPSSADVCVSLTIVPREV
jgi:hypothetical protein